MNATTPKPKTRGFTSENDIYRNVNQLFHPATGGPGGPGNGNKRKPWINDFSIITRNVGKPTKLVSRSRSRSSSSSTQKRTGVKWSDQDSSSPASVCSKTTCSKFTSATSATSATSIFKIGRPQQQIQERNQTCTFHRDRRFSVVATSLFADAVILVSCHCQHFSDRRRG